MEGEEFLAFSLTKVLLRQVASLGRHLESIFGHLFSLNKTRPSLNEWGERDIPSF